MVPGRAAATTPARDQTSFASPVRRIEVRVTSAVELNNEHKVRLEQLAARLSGRKPIMQFVVDASVIGGLVMQVGDFRFDYSLRRQLQLARTRLRERGDRGLRRTA